MEKDACLILSSTFVGWGSNIGLWCTWNPFMRRSACAHVTCAGGRECSDKNFCSLQLGNNLSDGTFRSSLWVMYINLSPWRKKCKKAETAKHWHIWEDCGGQNQACAPFMSEHCQGKWHFLCFFLQTDQVSLPGRGSLKSWERGIGGNQGNLIYEYWHLFITKKDWSESVFLLNEYHPVLFVYRH